MFLSATPWYKYQYTKGFRCLTDAEEARQWLLVLRDEWEMPFTQISRGSGVSIDKIKELYQRRRGRMETMHRADVAALLAFRPTRRPTASERALGAERLLRGLSAQGISTVVIARMIPYSLATIYNWRTRNHTDPPGPEAYDILMATAQKVERMAPAELGVTDQTRAQVKSRARTQRWAPLGAWEYETIHLPESVPEWTGACGTPVGFALHRRHGIPTCDRCKEARAQVRQEKGNGAA